MATFKSINVLPDSDSEDENDNTQEIQIEEALKLYQQALRHHTDRQWDEAQKAYGELFQSEIFQIDVEEQVHGRTNNVSSSLPLVQYLSFKNQGAFKLDRLKATISTQSEDEVRSEITQALQWFATALDRDTGDSALWRQSAQLALVLSSARLARFALESVLDHETIGTDASKDALSLVIGGNQNPEEHLAVLQLRKILEGLGDTLSLSDERFKGLKGRRLKKSFVKFLNPLPWLQAPLPGCVKTLATMTDEFSKRRRVVNVPFRTWAAVGKAILDSLLEEPEDDEVVVVPAHSNILQIVLPHYESEEESRHTTPDEPSPPDSTSKSENAVADDNDDLAMTDAASNLATAAVNDRRRSASANRKRKSTSMGGDGADSGRSRLSKRQRDKKAADAAAAEAAMTPESRAKVRQDAQDEKLFNTADDCFSPFGLSLGNARALKFSPPDVSTENNDHPKTDELCLEDFKAILRTWDDDKGNVILYGDGIQSPAEAAQGMSFLDLEANTPSRPLLAGDEGLRKWVKSINSRGLGAEQAAFEWLKALCRKDLDSRNKKSRGSSVSSGQSSWVKYNWPDFLKITVLSAVDNCEESCYQHLKNVDVRLSERSKDDQSNQFTPEDYADVEFAETILELYIDDLAAAERDKSGSDVSEDVELEIKRERAVRWKYLVGDLMHHRPRDADGQLEEDQLTLRYIWATAVMSGFTEYSSREFRLECFEDLKVLLAEREAPPIDLPNSSVMPEISAVRAERELSKLKTVDFFSTIFAATSDTNEKAPEEVIEILEAVLDPGAILPYDEEEERVLHEIGRFLEGSSAMFKLHLWEKLKAAYEKVKHPPKVLLCTYKCIQVIMSELKSRSYIDSSQDHRQFVLLRSMRLIKGLMGNALVLAMDKTNMAELTNAELKDALESILAMLRILHCYTFWENAVMKSEAKASDLHSYRLVIMKFKELLLQGWIMSYLLYATMLERGMGSDKEGGWTEVEKEEKLAGLLRDLHEELGGRHYCKLSNHLFLKLMFDELLRFNNREYDSEMLQVIHCRFHLTLCSDQWYFCEHKTIAEVLDRDTALKLLDFIMFHASKKKIAQLQKSDLKMGLDKLVEVFGIPRAGDRSARISHNLAVMDNYLKSSINPLQMFSCLRGDLNISTVEIFGERKAIAAKGLFFLQGKIALYQLKNNKKIGSLKTDELEAAVKYLRHDLACNPDSWETWYRMGQTFEVQMEDAQTWNSEYMNVKRAELVALERRTILCYMMAVSHSIQNADDEPETNKIIAELYTDFGYRIYSASRPPMLMQSFWTDGFLRQFSGQNGQGLYTSRPHSELNHHTALRYALTLFSRAADECEDNWKNHYMMGKCMAKLLEWRDYDVEDILQHYINAIKLCPEKGDVIFEPHHKLVSAATKFVLAERLQPKRACEILEASRFSKGIDHVEDRAGFILYVLEVFKKMKAADKQKWHHRMTNRIARLRYVELKDPAGARTEISSLFTKSAQLAIWRPEHERSGRHFVYASQYTMFHVELLANVGDRATMETVAKRVRRLPHGLYRHPDVWNFVFEKYIVVLRRSIPYRIEDEVFKDVSFDDFTNYSQKLDTHCNSLKDTQCPVLDTVREVFELRRLNGGLAKHSSIDDLLADSYAMLWQELVPAIMEAEKSQHNPMSLKNMMFDAAPPPVLPQSPQQPANPAAATDPAGAPPGGAKLDLDLPLRAKMTRVTRRELISKATNLCKEIAQASTSSSTAAAKSGSTGPSSPKGRPAEMATSDDGMQRDEDADLSALPPPLPLDMSMSMGN